MASPVTWLVDVAAEPEWLGPLYERLRSLFAEVEARLSRFDEHSDLTQLNRQVGQWVSVDPMLYNALTVASRAFRLTHGLFDPRVIGDLDRLGYQGAPVDMPPTGQNGGSWLEREPRERRLRINAPVDLGGIGKSLAVSWGARLINQFLKEIEASSPPMLLNAGGDLQMLGSAVPDPDGWMIGVEHPQEPDQYALALNFGKPAAVCTSSIRIRRWKHDGTWVHHLIDPREHKPGGTGLASVTVSHARPTWAEVWSKALFLQGAESIAAYAAHHRLTAWWLYADGTWDATPSGMDHVAWIGPQLKRRMSS